MGGKTRHVGCVQDEYRFYMEDAASKLLLIPTSGNKHAEAAASGRGIPIASMQFHHNGVPQEHDSSFRSCLNPATVGTLSFRCC